MTALNVVSSTFLEDVKKRFWGDKKEDATQPAASEKTLEKEMSENQNGQTLPSQPETSTNGDTGAPLRDTHQQQNPVRQPTQPDHPTSSPQVRDIEFGIRDININYHQMPSPPAGQNGGNNSEQEKDSKPPSSQYEFKQQRNNTSAIGNSYTSQAPGDHSNLTSPQAEGPHYGGSHSQTPRSLDGRFNGNVTDQSAFGGGFQDQNARNLPTQPAEWSGNGTYAPRTPGPRDNPYQTPPYQSPVNKNNINTPDQYNGGYNGNTQEQNGMNPQTPPSTWSGNGGYAPGPRDNSYYTPPYQSPVYNNNNNTPGQYSGNYAGNLQDQNGSNPQTLPPWPGNGGYNPETTGPHYNYHQTPPYQSPAYSNTPGQHLGYGNEVAPAVHCSYPQTSPTQGFSGNGYQNNLGDYYNAYGGWPGINGAATGANAPYNAFPGLKLNDPQTSQALFQAVRRGDVSAVEQLLRSSADPEVKNTFGYTPLWIAVQTEQLALIRLLLQYGADRTAMNTYGETILAWATKRNKKVIIETLSSM
ncbi:hypothetical protein TrVFT333_011692 [Trichoderma virens FT-333]|nr:hypothetical protein TrVFT333_011692 [Trichoderma virens FT-333]